MKAEYTKFTKIYYESRCICKKYFFNIYKFIKVLVQQHLVKMQLEKTLA
jgi:hypothetical protein